jgi:IS1 family transposase
MNRLSVERRGQIIGCLTEGMSIRGTVRVTGAAKNTVTKLLIDLGAACADYQDRTLRDLDCKTVEADEIWSFCYAKQKNVPQEFQGTPGYGDVWTWVAIDADTKLVPSWLVGERTLADAYAFVDDLRSRLRGPIQLTTDGFNLYLVVGDSLLRDRVDYTVLHKLYGASADPERTYSPARCIGVEGRVMMGHPDPERISTSYVERQNLTMRMGMRRFTRLTNGFSKKVENLARTVSLHYMHYNFARPHKGLGRGVTPAMAAGVAEYPWTVWDIAQLLD